MLGRDPDKEWEKFGRNDPYYGVMTKDRFHKEKLNKQSLIDFFDSGQQLIDYCMNTIRTSVQPDFSPTRTLDFGCGVGRCAIPLARVCPVVVGVDISDSMLKEARRNCIEQGITNLELCKSSDDLSGFRQFRPDLFFFYISAYTLEERGEDIKEPDEASLRKWSRGNRYSHLEGYFDCREGDGISSEKCPVLQ